MFPVEHKFLTDYRSLFVAPLPTVSVNESRKKYVFDRKRKVNITNRETRRPI